MCSVDHFHGGGLAATRALAELGALTGGEQVLDLGGGFGGPARTLAAEYGCQITVLDPTEPFIRAGQALTERLRLQDAVQFFLGSGLDLPFADEQFDMVWTQFACMNIPEKARLVAQQLRVLRRGGRPVFEELFAGPGGDLVCPVPWRVTQRPASWFSPSRSALSCVKLDSRSAFGFRKRLTNVRLPVPKVQGPRPPRQRLSAPPGLSSMDPTRRRWKLTRGVMRLSSASSVCARCGSVTSQNSQGLPGRRGSAGPGVLFAQAATGRPRVVFAQLPLVVRDTRWQWRTCQCTALILGSTNERTSQSVAPMRRLARVECEVRPAYPGFVGWEM